MTIVVRMDLKMGKGKVAAQCAHGAVGAYKQALRANPKSLSYWERYGAKKIALKVKDEAELLGIREACREAGLPTVIIRDAGTFVVSWVVDRLLVGWCDWIWMSGVPGRVLLVDADVWCVGQLLTRKLRVMAILL